MVPKTLLHVFIYPKPAKRIHRKVTMRERSVTGIPTLACSTKPKDSLVPGAILDIIVHLPDGLTSKLKGKVRRTSKNPVGKVMGSPVKTVKSGMGIEIIEKDTNYLHLLRVSKLNRHLQIHNCLLFVMPAGSPLTTCGDRLQRASSGFLDSPVKPGNDN